MRLVLTRAQRRLVLRPVVGKGGFQSLLRRIQRSLDLATSAIEVSTRDLEVMLRELSKGKPRGGWQNRLGGVLNDPPPAADRRRPRRRR